jgi:hypothetical protein
MKSMIKSINLRYKINPFQDLFDVIPMAVWPLANHENLPPHPPLPANGGEGWGEEAYFLPNFNSISLCVLCDLCG